ncbi:putative feruloyl esterase A [Balamuthia mandrillaris]
MKAEEMNALPPSPQSASSTAAFHLRRNVCLLVSEREEGGNLVDLLPYSCSIDEEALLVEQQTTKQRKTKTKTKKQKQKPTPSSSSSSSSGAVVGHPDGKQRHYLHVHHLHRHVHLHHRSKKGEAEERREEEVISVEVKEEVKEEATAVQEKEKEEEQEEEKTFNNCHKLRERDAGYFHLTRTYPTGSVLNRHRTVMFHSEVPSFQRVPVVVEEEENGAKEREEEEDEERRMKKVAGRFNSEHALFCCYCAVLAYEEPQVVKQVVLGLWGWKKVAYFKNLETDTQAFGMFNGEILVLSFCGTKSSKDWVTNVKIRPQKHARMEAIDGYRVHYGFNKGVCAIYPELRMFVEEALNANPNARIFLTGHSLGGALAVLAYAKFAMEETCICRTFGCSIDGLYTFGQPPVGNKMFREAMEESLRKGGVYFRVTNKNDIVPAILTKPFIHCGTRIYISSKQDFVLVSSYRQVAGDKFKVFHRKVIHGRVIPYTNDHHSNEYLYALEHHWRHRFEVISCPKIIKKRYRMKKLENEETGLEMEEVVIEEVDSSEGSKGDDISE